MGTMAVTTYKLTPDEWARRVRPMLRPRAQQGGSLCIDISDGSGGAWYTDGSYLSAEDRKKGLALIRCRLPWKRPEDQVRGLSKLVATLRLTHTGLQAM